MRQDNIDQLTSDTYNKRLFEGNSLRAMLHISRFEWFRRMALKFFPQQVNAVELGCFNGRLLSYFPTPPLVYEGFDAGWEGGLDWAQEQFREHRSWRFTKSADPKDLQKLPRDSFEVAIALETLEHLPPDEVEIYLAELARITKGYLLVSVPNEKGLVFLFKYIAKRISLGNAEPYSLSEVFYATLGRMTKVSRREHKGFDYEWLHTLIARHFEILEIGGLPWRLPPFLAFTVTFVARSRK